MSTPEPQLPRNFLRGPGFWQADLMVSKDFRFLTSQGLQFRLDSSNGNELQVFDAATANSVLFPHPKAPATASGLSPALTRWASRSPPSNGRST